MELGSLQVANALQLGGDGADASEEHVLSARGHESKSQTFESCWFRTRL